MFMFARTAHTDTDTGNHEPATSPAASLRTPQTTSAHAVPRPAHGALSISTSTIENIADGPL